MYVCVRVIATTTEQQRCYFAQVHVRMSPIVFSNVPHSQAIAIGPYCIDKSILLGLHSYDFGIAVCGATKGRKYVRGFSCLRVQISLYNNYPVNLRHFMPRTSRNVFVTSTSLFIARPRIFVWSAVPGTLHLPFTILSPFNTW